MTGYRDVGDRYADDWWPIGGRLIRGWLVTDRRETDTRMTGDREAWGWYADDWWPRCGRLINGWLVTKRRETDTRMTGYREAGDWCADDLLPRGGRLIRILLTECWHVNFWYAGDTCIYRSNWYIHNWYTLWLTDTKRRSTNFLKLLKLARVVFEPKLQLAF